MKKTIWFVQILKLIVFLLLVFAVAGTWNYWQGWVFFSYIMLMIPIVLIFFKDKMDLAKERLHPGKGMKAWDKVILVIMVVLVLATFIIPVLDSGRFKWTHDLPVYFYVTVYIVMTFGNFFILWAMHTCKWFSSVVRIQKDRKQKVVSTGPYAIVRHPGYLGGLFIFITLPLTLGSLYGLIPSLLVILVIIARTHLEDKTLIKELEG